MNNLFIFLAIEWYYLTLIIVGLLLVVTALLFLIYYLISLAKKKKINNEAKEYYQKVIEAVGGIDNIVDVNVNSSRLSFVLNDPSKLNDKLLEGVGIVKSSKKITLVIGSMANNYYQKIKNELKK